MQITQLFPNFDDLHLKHGSSSLMPIYGAGQVQQPNICLIFMNPTAKNVASSKNWAGIRAPWLGTKNVWKLFNKLGLFNNTVMLERISSMRPEDWTPEFAEDLYQEIANESVYITNIAKCTQDDARHLSDSVYKEYLPLMLEELEAIQPQLILTLGNQVSSVLLDKPISVSNYAHSEYEDLATPNSSFKVYPAYYPIGQGMRNMQKAIERIKTVIELSRRS